MNEAMNNAVLITVYALVAFYAIYLGWLKGLSCWNSLRRSTLAETLLIEESARLETLLAIEQQVMHGGTHEERLEWITLKGNSEALIAKYQDDLRWA